MEKPAEPKPGVASSEFFLGGGLAYLIVESDPVYAWPLAALAVGYALSRALDKAITRAAAVFPRRQS